VEGKRDENLVDVGHPSKRERMSEKESNENYDLKVCTIPVARRTCALMSLEAWDQ